jgi:hypothetical protein
MEIEMTAPNYFHLANHIDPDFTAAWKVLEAVRQAIGDDNWYAWMRPLRSQFPNGTNPRLSWPEVERIAARKLYLVTVEAHECNCNGVEYCSHHVTVDDGTQPLPF